MAGSWRCRLTATALVNEIGEAYAIATTEREIREQVGWRRHVTERARPDCNDSAPDDSPRLRQRAEERPRRRGPGAGNLLSPKEPALLHELQVHQIELEMQNEELRRAQEELEASRARYFDLYDLAPVGYFTLSEQGLILEANLTAARLLGVERSALVKQPLSRFILPEDQDIYYRHRKQLFETGAPQVWELRLLRQDAAPLLGAGGGDHGAGCRRNGCMAHGDERHRPTASVPRRKRRRPNSRSKTSGW